MIKPIGENILVEPLEQSETTKSGLMIASKSESKPEQGTIIEVGKDCNSTVKKGDKVIFKKYAPDEIVINEKKYLIMKEVDILAIIE